MTRTSLNALVESWKARALKAEQRVAHLENISQSRITELEAMVHELSERLKFAREGATQAEHLRARLEVKIKGLEEETRRWSEAHRLQTIEHLNECRRVRDEHRSKLF